MIHRVSVPAPALRRNMVHDKARDRVSVYLPPSYATHPLRRYPVLYFLHGFDADDRALIQGHYQNLNIRVSMDSLVRGSAVREMIVVMPNARNAFDGSFYTDSPVTGKWEQFIAHDVVSYVDGNYRTLRTREARGLAGHSMGGYGALWVALRNPGTFSAVYALSACCLAFSDFTTATYEKSWRSALALRDWRRYKKAGFITDLLMAFGAANAPDTKRRPFYVALPYRLVGDSLALNHEIARRWTAGPLAMLPRYSSNARRLAIAFDAGTEDGFRDIPVRAVELDSLMTALRVPHSFELYSGNHGDHIRARIESKVLPFFSIQLTPAR